MRLHWLLAALVSSLVLVTADVWALANAIFWRWRWFDTPMHILGGFTLGLFAIGLMPSYRPRFFIAFVASAAIGWEIFELIANVPQPNPVFVDTIHDLVNDGLGAMFAFALAREMLWLPRK